MAILLPLENERTDKELVFFCPGCQQGHSFRIERGSLNPNAPVWQWNGDFEKPTFTPSLLVNRGTERQCHLFVSDGKIQYLQDCHHEYRGCTVDMVEMEW